MFMQFVTPWYKAPGAEMLLEYDGNTQTITYSGMLMGDDLKLTATGGRGPQELAFKRAK